MSSVCKARKTEETVWLLAVIIMNDVMQTRQSNIKHLSKQGTSGVLAKVAFVKLFRKLCLIYLLQDSYM